MGFIPHNAGSFRVRLLQELSARLLGVNTPDGFNIPPVRCIEPIHSAIGYGSQFWMLCSYHRASLTANHICTMVGSGRCVTSFYEDEIARK